MNTILIIILITLGGCATQHIPKTFPAYFSLQPESVFSSRHIYEARELEQLPAMSMLQMKRLSDLYSLEYSTSKSDERKQFLHSRIDRFRPDLAEFENDVRSISEKNRRANVVKKNDEDPFGDSEVKARYSEGQSLWNKDQNNDALVVLSTIRESNVSDLGILKIEYLFFRILLEQGDLPNAEASYLKIKQMSRCGFEAVQSALLLSLHIFGSGNLDEAFRIWSDQCDEDTSQGNLNRKDYWLARFSKDDVLRKSKLDALSFKMAPDFYALMARFHLGQSLNRPEKSDSPRPYLSQPLTVSREIHRLLERGEERLGANLKRDASVYLSRASQIIRDDKDASDVLTALYIAYLLQAAGNHLEAMKLFNWLPQIVTEETKVLLSHPDLVRDMFPTPFLVKVEWNAKTWKVDPDLVYSLMRQESAFNPGAISSADARGLMQLMPFLAKYLAKRWKYDAYYQPKNLLNAEENLKLAIFHLHQLQELVPHIALVAASYNAGVQRTSNWWRKYGKYPLDVFIELIPVQETRNYAKYVIRNFSYYRALRTGSVQLNNLFSLSMPALPGGVLAPGGMNSAEPEKENPQGNP